MEIKGKVAQLVFFKPIVCIEWFTQFFNSILNLQLLWRELKIHFFIPERIKDAMASSA